MRAAVANIFPAFTAHFEGRTGWPYLDEKGLATVGAGDLIEPTSVALALPWQIAGVPASSAEVAIQLAQLHKAPPGRLASYYCARTTIRLTDAAIDELVAGKMASDEAILRGRIPSWDALPANAQLATMSLAWAVGPDFAFPRYLEALAAEDWATAAVESHMDESGNKGLVDRNVAVKALLEAQAAGADPDTVSWP